MNQKININIDDLKDIPCGNCGSLLFTQVIKLKNVPKIQSPDGNGGVVRAAGVVCVDCGHSEAEAIKAFEQKEKEEFESKVVPLIRG